MKISSPILGLLIFLLNGINAKAQNFWEQTSGPEGGYVTALQIDTDGIIYAGTSSGVFVSTNSGQTWDWSGKDIKNQEVTSLAVNGKNNNVFAGLTFQGIYRSTDHGNSWTAASNGLPTDFINDIVANSSGDLFAAAGYDLSSVEIYISKDNGQTWSWSSTGVSGNIVDALAINSKGDLFAGASIGGVYLSINNGKSWDTVSNGLPSDVIINCLAVNKKDDLFAGAIGKIYRSTDNGNSWKEITTGFNPGKYADVEKIVVNPVGDIFAGTSNGIFRSTDNGDHWTAIDTGLTNQQVFSLIISTNGNLLAGSYFGGIFKSIDNGNHWAASNKGLINSTVKSLYTHSNKVIAGTYFNGVYLSTDGGEKWQQINGQKISGERDINCITGNTNGDLFLGALFYDFNNSTSESGVFRSSDLGQHWIKLDTGLTDTNIRDMLFTQGDTLFVATGHGVFRSDDNGAHWTSMSNGISVNSITSLALNSKGVIFAGGPGKVFRSADQGKNWQDVSTGLKTSYRTLLALDKDDILFAGTDGEGVFRSTNDGDQWTQMNKGLTTKNIQSITINDQGVIYVGTYYGPYSQSFYTGGVFRSVDTGNHWDEISSGLTSTFVMALTTDSSGSLYAGTMNGVFRSSDTHTYLEEIHDNPSSLDLYPNPFAYITNITYHLTEPSFVNLEIFNSQGVKVTTLVNDLQNKGTHLIQWNTQSDSKWHGGLYFCRLIINSTNGDMVSETRKLILMK